MARPVEFNKDTALQNAMYTFWKKGYVGASIADLTKAMGISRSSMYEAFGDKQALFLGALDLYLERNARAREGILKKARSVRRGLTEYFSSVIDFLTSGQHPAGCLFTNTASGLGAMNAAIRERVTNGLDRMEKDFQRLLRKGQQGAASGRARDIRATARYCVALTRGITVLATISAARAALEEIVRIGLAAIR